MRSQIRTIRRSMVIALALLFAFHCRKVEYGERGRSATDHTEHWDERSRGIIALGQRNDDKQRRRSRQPRNR